MYFNGYDTPVCMGAMAAAIGAPWVAKHGEQVNVEVIIFHSSTSSGMLSSATPAPQDHDQPPSQTFEPA